MSESPRLSTGDQPVPVSQEAQLDGLCDEFERALKSGTRPRIEDFLVRVPETARTLGLKELLGIELEIRRAAGEPLLADDYLRRFSGQREIVESEFQRLLRSSSAVTTQRFSGVPGTAEVQPGPGAENSDDRDLPEDPMPQRLGRFEIRHVLGEGGFGRVYLAFDPVLDRPVAIKVPNPRRFSAGFNVEAFLAEARHAAKLKHPGLVTVHEVQQDAERPYIVQEYVDGPSLGKWAREHQPSYRDIARILMEVSDAVGFAHEKRLFHRDLKPGNILVDSLGHPHVADFGLALDHSRRCDRVGTIDGTRPYMSPEQFRGETHRLDGRTDLWSLGVVLYELLVHSRPFSGRNDSELLTNITTFDPLPPRQLDPRVPRELERICLKCLEKRCADRYTTATDLVDDLRHWLESSTASDAAPAAGVGAPPLPDASSARTAIVPKGLRSFDEQDADFFLELLPGPRGRDGLPESIRFWKTRIEETDPDKVFSVGLLYGPSGCGKSSLVKAGLLPRLAPDVAAVYVEATPQDTEVRLLKGLRKHVPQVPAGASLPESLLWLRENLRARDRKILIVLDQFEQWLHAHSGEEGRQLIDALRHCDGIHVQCLVLVRDDFYVAVNRFFQELEIPILEGQNYALVDLFDLDHARKVLTAFGRAYGKLAESTAELKIEQLTFLSQAVSGLAQEGKVICVRLALFVERMKGRAWTADSLRDVGGTEGVGVTFLEETFSVSTAPPTHRLHQSAARAVLKALLPEMGTDIKGRMQPYEKLLDVSGYTRHPGDFSALLAILESEVRLIAPTEPDATGSGRGATDVTANARHYQLTHDFLVPALRDWLTRKQSETRRGRAELRLAERTALWTRKPEQKQLPSSWETLNILALTRRSTWTDLQLKMMRLAIRRHATRIAGAVAMVVSIVTAGIVQKRHSDHKEQLDRGSRLVDTLLVADAERLPDLLQAVRATPAVPFERLRKIAHSADEPLSGRLRAHLALAADDRQSIPFLLDALQTADLREYAVIRSALHHWKDEAAPQLWPLLRQEVLPGARRLRVAGELSDFDPNNSEWRAVAENVCRALVDENPASVTPWVEILRPVEAILIEPLTRRFRDSSAPASVRVIAAGILAKFVEADPELLSELIVTADSEQFELLFEPLHHHGPAALRLLEDRLVLLASQDQPAPHDQLVRAQAVAAVTLMRLGRSDPIWRFLGKVPEPDVRTELIAAFQRFHISARELIEHLDVERDSVVRYSLLLALGEYYFEGLNEAERNVAAARVGELYSDDDDPGVHSAAAWLLGVWKQPVAPVAVAPEDKRNWHVTSEGHVMCELSGPVTFQKGSPETEAGRDHIETLHDVNIPHAFAISTHEVTIDEFRRFEPSHPFAPEIGPEGTCPVNKVSWIAAARYCNWLSRRAGMSDDELVYPLVPTITDGLRVPAENLNRHGYRLPTEDEWEFACRAGARTKWFFGQSDAPLPRFGRYLANSDEHTWPVGQLRPNPFGLFDTYGNVHEWCHDTYDGNDAVSAIVRTDVDLGGPDVRPGERLFRGGSYRSMTRLVRTAKRYSYPPNTNLSPLGFRIARTMPD